MFDTDRKKKLFLNMNELEIFLILLKMNFKWSVKKVGSLKSASFFDLNVIVEDFMSKAPISFCFHSM